MAMALVRPHVSKPQHTKDILKRQDLQFTRSTPSLKPERNYDLSKDKHSLLQPLPMYLVLVKTEQNAPLT